MKKIFFYFSFFLLAIITIFLVFKDISLPTANVKENVQQITKVTPKKANTPDLSYILVVTDANAHISLVNPSRKSVGTVSTTQPLVDPTTGKSAGNPIQQLTYEQPENGMYSLTISSPTPTSLSIYLYDTEANFIDKKIEADGTVVFSIVFSKENLKNSSIQEL